MTVPIGLANLKLTLEKSILEAEKILESKI